MSLGTTIIREHATIPQHDQSHWNAAFGLYGRLRASLDVVDDDEVAQRATAVAVAEIASALTADQLQTVEQWIRAARQRGVERGMEIMGHRSD